jgi:hypothetical protein
MIRFDFDAMKWEGLEAAQIETWEKLYPDLSIKDELVDMIRWLDRVKHTKKANKRNWKKFIVNWLTRAQKKAVIGGFYA